MSKKQTLPIGIYERLLDEELAESLSSCPELKPVLRSIDDESAPHSYAQFIGQLLDEALRITKKEDRIPILNRIIELLSSTDGLDYLKRRTLLSDDKNLLTAFGSSTRGFIRPQTPLSTSSLLTGLGADPPLEHELRAEMESADRVDMLISFIKWSGLRLLLPAFERLAADNIPVRIISTSYMGASDPAAMEWLAKQPNVEVRISYDTGGTRLHAKAYHFIRNSGYSTAYIGSANMSHSAMTGGLEWTVKVTAQDMPHILDRFIAEFSTYWESNEFEPFLEKDFGRFRRSIGDFRTRAEAGPLFFAEITPRPFQARILDVLAADRQSGWMKNLVVAATGTGKTVISALDYQRYAAASGKKERLLFVAHRKEILDQALGCFRTVLRDRNFGELLVDGREPEEWQHVFASVQSLNSRKPWENLGAGYFRYVVVDEAHHGSASSYRPLFEHLQPEILLGLTATPERMDGSSILPDFDKRYSAEIRLPEALEEKLLCPFHYFGVTDSVDLVEERFWKHGRYDAGELEKVFTGDDIRAHMRVDNILQALGRYQPDLDSVHGVGFCAGRKHAHYMADHFNKAGIASEVLLGDTPGEERSDRLRRFKEGKITFLFAVDVLSEGVDVPDINLVLFLRPTESITVFLQQLGRGLRHATGKECLTVLDFVGQTHQKYRMDTRFTSLLSRNRERIDREIEKDFPHLPPGCSIQLERVAREIILKKISMVLDDLKHFIPETIRTWDAETSLPLTFGNFIDATGLSPIEVLKRNSWSEWKAMAGNEPLPEDPDIKKGRKALSRIALRSDPNLLYAFEQIGKGEEVAEDPALHYVMWGEKAEKIGVSDFHESVDKWRENKSIAADAAEIAAWRRISQSWPVGNINLPFPCTLQLHASYGLAEIKTALGLATLQESGPTGLGVIHAEQLNTYVHLVTFNKSDNDFSPTTRYRDYLISRKVLHWESQSNITRDSKTGLNYRHFSERNYTILFFARVEKRISGETAPFIFLGPAQSYRSFESDRPIRIEWELSYPVPAALFEEVRPV